MRRSRREAALARGAYTEPVEDVLIDSQESIRVVYQFFHTRLVLRVGKSMPVENRIPRGAGLNQRRPRTVIVGTACIQVKLRVDHMQVCQDQYQRGIGYACRAGLYVTASHADHHQNKERQRPGEGPGKHSMSGVFKEEQGRYRDAAIASAADWAASTSAWVRKVWAMTSR